MLLGKSLGVHALAAVGATGAINCLIIGFVVGICSGCAIPVAQRFGAQDFSAMRKYVCNSAYVCIFFSVVMTAVTVVFCRPLLLMMNTPEDIVDRSVDYVRIIFAGIPFIFLYNVVAAIVRSLGDSKTPLYFLVMSSVMNITLDLVFILVMKWDVKGAAGDMLRKELRKKGYPFHACFDVKMASNYIMFGDIKPDEIICERLKAAKPIIEKIKTQVDNKEHFIPAWTFIDCFLTESMRCLCDRYMSVKKFHADEDCTGCGTCVQNCPSSLIKMIDGKPKWTENKCVRCMACLKCSHVQFNEKSSTRRRYSFEKYNALLM